MSLESTALLNHESNLLGEGSVLFLKQNPKKLAWNDIAESFQKWRIWFLLAYQDIKLRYRRSILGPFWITLSMAITVYSMGYLYGHLFHIPLATYFPYLVAGMLAWSLISASLTDLTDAFMTYESMIKQMRLPFSLHIQRIIMRHFIIFCHNLLVMLPVYIFFHASAPINLHTLFLFPAFLLLYCNCFCYGLILAMISARYRDISQIIKSFIQIVFFITPILWSPSVLPDNKLFVVWGNPFYSFVEIIRKPLLGELPSMMIIVSTLLITLVGLLFSFLLFVRYRSRIVYWL